MRVKILDTELEKRGTMSIRLMTMLKVDLRLPKLKVKSKRFKNIAYTWLTCNCLFAMFLMFIGIRALYAADIAEGILSLIIGTNLITMACNTDYESMLTVEED